MQHVLLALGLLAGSDATGFSSDWIEVKSPNFTVVGTAKEKDAKAVAQHFESMRIVFQASMPGSFADPAQPVVVYAMRKDSDFDALYGKKVSDQMGGAFRNVGHSLHISMRLGLAGGADESAFIIAAHEYHHVFLDRLGSPVPVWLREGLANLWGGTYIKGKTVEVGSPRTFAMYAAHAGRMPLLTVEELLAVDHRSKHYNEADRAGIFYSEATVLTHMLVLGEKDGEAKLRRFVGLLEAGKPQKAAFEETFGDLKKVDDRLHAYLRKPSYNFVRSTLRGTIEESSLSVRKLSTGETLTLHGAFLLYENRKEAERVLARALEVAPSHPKALQAKGLLELWKGERGEAFGLFSRAADAEGAGFFPHYLVALTASNAEPSFVEKHLAASVEANPRYAPAMFRLAAARVSRDPEAAMKLAVDAARLDPGKPEHLLRAARIFRLAGKKNDASQLATQAMMRALSRNDADVANSVCWSGAIGGFASVVYAACESAVSLSPEAWEIRDSRGLARALVGDKKGAVEDFRFAIDTSKHSDEARHAEFVKLRTSWIKTLEAGKNPFDRATLDTLEEGAAWDL